MPSTRYQRHGEDNLGFDRVMFFTDAVFEAFQDKGPRIFAFFLGCYVIGS